MGRYYNGDISGNFWFGIQSSRSPERFGCQDVTPADIHWYIDEKQPVIDGIKDCLKNLKGIRKKIDDFFAINDSYTDERLSEYLEVTLEQTRYLLSEYADLGLGVKILKCLNKQGECNF